MQSVLHAFTYYRYDREARSQDDPQHRIENIPDHQEGDNYINCPTGERITMPKELPCFFPAQFSAFFHSLLILSCFKKLFIKRSFYLWYVRERKDRCPY